MDSKEVARLELEVGDAGDSESIAISHRAQLVELHPNVVFVGGHQKIDLPLLRGSALSRVGHIT
jgi:hypothetical protein